MSLMVYLQLAQRRAGIIFSACWGPNNEYLELHWVGMVTRRDVALIGMWHSSLSCSQLKSPLSLHSRLLGHYSLDNHR